jgi:hypothetical protein
MVLFPDATSVASIPPASNRVKVTHTRRNSDPGPEPRMSSINFTTNTRNLLELPALDRSFDYEYNSEFTAHTLRTSRDDPLEIQGLYLAMESGTILEVFVTSNCPLVEFGMQPNECSAAFLDLFTILDIEVS